jgi:hypothetical protein
MGLFTEREEETTNEIIIGKLNRIEAKLDKVIAAMHAYDDENIEDVNEGYGESSFESFMDTKNDILSWDVDGAERRMDIIGQNGNEGLHYDSHHVTNEEADEDANNNTQGKDKDKRTGGNKKKYYNKYSKTKTSKMDNQKYIKTKDNGRL